jgi:hypothetical protein
MRIGIKRYWHLRGVTLQTYNERRTITTIVDCGGSLRIGLQNYHSLYQGVIRLFACGTNLVITMEEPRREGCMKSGPRQETATAIDFQDPVSELQPLIQYLEMLKTSLDRFTYLKESGASEVILYVEKGLIDRQLLFLSRVCGRLDV